MPSQCPWTPAEDAVLVEHLRRTAGRWDKHKLPRVGGRSFEAIKCRYLRLRDAGAWKPEAKATVPEVEIPVEWEEPAPEQHPVEQRERWDREARLKRQVAELVEELRQARARQSFLDLAEEHRAPPRIMSREKSPGVREMTAVVLASDWHVEETVEPESIAYRNAYNLEVADQRIKRFFGAIVWNIEHHRASGRVAIRDLVLWLGGDLMSGYIHPELVENNALSPSETILWLLPRLRDGIATLLDVLDLEHIELPCSFGNHGRSTEKRRVSSGYANSWEWLAYHQLASEFRAEQRVHFEITQSSHQYVEVFGSTLHFHHGDEVKYQGGVGGLGIPLLKKVPAWDRIREAEVHNIGHHHTFKDFGRAVVNGSLIGYNSYAQSIGADFEPPWQMLYYLDSKRGKSMVTKLWVEEHEPEVG